jgi:transposase
MPRRPRRNHSSAFKAKVALKTIKGEQSVIEIAELHAKIGELTMENDFLSVALGRTIGTSAKR